MKYTVLFLLVVLFGDCFCQAKPSEAQHVREKYEDSLRRAMKILNEGKIPRVKLIEYCIPETADESALFYSLDQQKENSNSFHILGRKIRELISAGNEPVFKKYLALSQFVDGYFAEGYFDHIESIIEKQKELFCKTIKTLPQEKRKRLSEYKAKADCL